MNKKAMAGIIAAVVLVAGLLTANLVVMLTGNDSEADTVAKVTSEDGTTAKETTAKETTTKETTTKKAKDNAGEVYVFSGYAVVGEDIPAGSYTVDWAQRNEYDGWEEDAPSVVAFRLYSDEEMYEKKLRNAKDENGDADYQYEAYHSVDGEGASYGYILREGQVIDVLYSDSIRFTAE